MKVYFGLEEFSGAKNPAVTTGTFDGVHIGHKKILGRLKEVAKANDGESILLTFHPHPRLVLFPENKDLHLLNTQKEKIGRLDKAGIDHLIIHPFTLDFSRLSAIEYVRDVLVNQLDVHSLVIGYDHHFGRNREGSFEDLVEFGNLYSFKVEEIPAHDIDDIKVSSTKIRHALEKGDIEQANKFLGYNYPLSGKVTRGKGIGKSMGFPTANIKLSEKEKLIPAIGVYACRVHVGQNEFMGMLNIGFRPTVHANSRKTIEVHIIDFEQNIYGEGISVHLVERIRDEKKFENLDGLKEQLNLDKQKTYNLLNYP